MTKTGNVKAKSFSWYNFCTTCMLLMYTLSRNRILWKWSNIRGVWYLGLWGTYFPMEVKQLSFTHNLMTKFIGLEKLFIILHLITECSCGSCTSKWYCIERFRQISYDVCRGSGLKILQKFVLSLCSLVSLIDFDGGFDCFYYCLVLIFLALDEKTLNCYRWFMFS